MLKVVRAMLISVVILGRVWLRCSLIDWGLYRSKFVKYVGLVENVEYFVWERVDGGALTWT